MEERNAKNPHFSLPASKRKYHTRRHQSQEAGEKRPWHHRCHAAFPCAGKHERRVLRHAGYYSGPMKFMRFLGRIFK